MRSRILWVCVLAVIMLVQLWLFLSWARPRVLRIYASPKVLESLDTSADTSKQTVVHGPQHTYIHRNRNANEQTIPYTPQHTHLHKNSSHPHLDVIVGPNETVHEHSSEPSFLHPVHSNPHPIDSSLLSEMFHTDGATWKPGSFCEDFFERRYHTSVDVCGPPQGSDQVKCSWNPQNAHAATCDIDNLMVQPDGLWKAMQAVNDRFPGSKSIWMIEGSAKTCPTPTIRNLARTMEGGDYVKKFVEDLLAAKTKPRTECKQWINETVFFFNSHAHHIYFRFLAYYSLHKSLLDHHMEGEKYRIFRLTEGFNYLFPDYERALFPTIEPLTALPSVRTCFRKAVLVPKCYATILFQCKMQGNIRQKCLACDGRNLPGTTLMSFRRRVLAACGLDDWKSEKSDTKLLTVILRKPYTRWQGDHPNQFQRVLSNSGELIAGLKEAFPNTIVKPVHMEDLSACEQVSYTHNADVLMGVHGAGLVHLWWLREGALMIELEPYFEQGNPSFKTLAKVTGRRYLSIGIPGHSAGVTVDVNNVIKQIKAHSDLS